MPNTLAQLANEGQYATGLSRQSGNPIGRWIQGVAGRSTPSNMLSALASEAQRYQSMPAGELAAQFGAGGGSGLVGMFAGRGAKTANLAELARAEEMAKAGVPDPQIWRETGWTLDTPDRVPRFEIPDIGATSQYTHLPEIGSSRISERAIEHPELFGAYPDTQGITQLGLRESQPTGSMDSLGGYLTAKAPNVEELKGVGLHELQHAIQQREGFARGGSPEMFKSSPESLQGLHTYDDMAHAEQIINMAKQYGKTVDEFMQNPPRWVTDKQVAIAKNFENRPAQDLQYAKNYIIEKTDPREAYTRLAGEAEARLTQARMNMTPEQRLAQYPYDPEYFQGATGVGLKDLIVRNDGGTAMSSPQSGGNIPQLISDMAEARRVYEAQRAARLAQPQQNTMANLAAGAGALGAGAGLGYYGTEYLLGDR